MASLNRVYLIGNVTRDPNFVTPEWNRSHRAWAGERNVSSPMKEASLWGPPLPLEMLLPPARTGDVEAWSMSKSFTIKVLGLEVSLRAQRWPREDVFPFMALRLATRLSPGGWHLEQMNNDFSSISQSRLFDWQPDLRTRAFYEEISPSNAVSIREDNLCRIPSPKSERVR